MLLSIQSCKNVTTLSSNLRTPRTGARATAPEMSTAADAVADAAALTVIHFVLYVLAGIAIGVSVGVNIYVVIALEDLQSDLVNPHDATRRINRLVVWDIGSHAIGTVFMLLSGHWIVAAMNAPLIYYHAEG